ncbi:VOC family protein [Pontibacter sp. G13]|uniref:VOC family protein n=1 Tax=Pontibacter sp. G13 TaxID=3074898 RepID=UPI00288B016A|nr:VOC family protein [Pontibacter sp. G13]WNJ16731.1 VOC family protein [Pontibacter sp. G13]
MNTSDLTFTTYLTFDGQCAEAMKFYQGIFGGELLLLPFDPRQMKVPESHLDKIMHSTLDIGTTKLMASDTLPGFNVRQGNAYTISIGLTDPEEATRIFHALSVQGDVIMPLQDTFWNARYGQVQDRFGIQWMMNCDLGAQT